MKQYSVIKSTFKTKTDADKFSELLFSKKLIASAQLNEINSHYIWKNELVNHKEFEATYFTKSSLFSRIEKCSKESHPYETPQLIGFSIDNITSDFAKWIEENTD